MTTRTPNLFTFATSELSQDAVVCWLASWADPALREIDAPLHATATAFLDRLLEVGGGPRVAAYRTVEVRRQWHDIDVLLVVNGDTAVIIEDKTDTRDHSGQLERYRRAAALEFPPDRTAAVYLKSGDQCEYRSAERAGYGCFLRGDFLGILGRGKDLGVTNDVFADFHRHLLGIERAVRGFADVPPGEWGRRQWVGFFTALRERLGDGEWAVRGHGGGGSLTLRWHRTGDKYLRLHGGVLAFCLEVADEYLREAMWAEWNRSLVASSRAAGVTVTTPRRKPGRRMTVAVLGGDYRHADPAGRLDLDQTLGVLRKAEALMDATLVRVTGSPESA